MKKILTILAAALVASSAQAQLAQHKLYGSGTRHEQASRILALPDGTSIIGGTVSTPVAANGSYADVNIFLTKITANGAILWQRQVYTPSSTTSDEVLHSIRLANNGDLLVAGVVGRTVGNIYANNNAFIARFDSATGAMNWYNTYKRSTPGEVFEDVAELSDGRIIAVGTYQYDGTSSERGLVNVYTSTGTFVYSESIDPNGLDEFQGVVVDRNDVYVTGRFGSSPAADTRVMKYQPGASSGTVVWESIFTVSGMVTNSGAALRHVVRFDKPYMRGNDLLVNGLMASDAGIANGSAHFIFKLDKNTQATSVLSIGTTSNFANRVSFHPIDANTIVSTENPNNSTYALNSWGVASTNSNVSHTVAFGTPSVVTGRNFAPGTNKIEIADVSMHGSNIYLVGSTRTGAAFHNDIYYCISAISLNSTTADCTPAGNNPALGAPTTIGASLLSTVSLLSSTPRASIQDAATAFLSEKICGDSVTTTSTDTSCKLQCYWRVDGNNSVNPGNFLGTVNAADLILKTTGIERARVKNTGEFGVHTSAPAANLDVECSPGNYPSGLRFENLPTTKTVYPFLVVDPSGYVYQYTGSIRDYPRPAGGGTQGSTEHEIAELREQVRLLTAYVTKLNNDIPLSGAALDASPAIEIYPNPSDGKVNVRYQISGGFKAANLVITDMKGQRILEYPLNTASGTAMISIPGYVTASELVCTLYVEGKAVSSQKLLVYKK